MIICDIDNCISDDMHRAEFIDWEADNVMDRFHRYHMAIPWDRPANLEMIYGQEVVFLTAMPKMYLMLRKAWMMRHEIDHIKIWCRADDDHRPSPIMKVDAVHDILNHYRITERDITGFFDDRMDVIEAIRDTFTFRAERVWVHDHEVHKPPPGITIKEAH